MISFNALWMGPLVLVILLSQEHSMLSKPEMMRGVSMSREVLTFSGLFSQKSSQATC